MLKIWKTIKTSIFSGSPSVLEFHFLSIVTAIFLQQQNQATWNFCY